MQNIFLDLDGTLVDPRIGITTSIRHALSEMGVEASDPDELTWFIGPPLRESFEVLLGAGADIERAVALYRDYYSDEGLFEAELYDGVGEMLMDLRDTGAALWIATSKPHVYAERVVEEFGISAWVEGIFGAELDGTRATKTEVLAEALAQTGADPAQSLMLGDRRHDIEGARMNGMAVIGALWGYGDPEELRMSEPDALAGAPGEVAELALDILGIPAEEE